ncbi:hypothetical protein K488DRAFT_88832 [Vararia minispora EC-137]|uniref:Uncharacterized protein n=1 Tax=Vararia minispora EC-137 TaxID=1314806 RepID=A0ACB8QCH9_9AGAM|nr:hypothetical protein K488DRAFT_88832 [Vararia minispora EC-137]
MPDVINHPPSSAAGAKSLLLVLVVRAFDFRLAVSPVEIVRRIDVVWRPHVMGSPSLVLSATPPSGNPPASAPFSVNEYDCMLVLDFVFNSCNPLSMFIPYKALFAFIDKGMEGQQIPWEEWGSSKTCTLWSFPGNQHDHPRDGCIHGMRYIRPSPLQVASFVTRYLPLELLLLDFHPAHAPNGYSADPTAQVTSDDFVFLPRDLRSAWYPGGMPQLFVARKFDLPVEFKQSSYLRFRISEDTILVDKARANGWSTDILTF